MFKKLLVGVILVLLLSGCATMELQKSVGSDIREIILRNGPPGNVVDLEDGVRAYQWASNKSVYVPRTTTTYSSTQSLGYSTYGSSSTTTRGGYTNNFTCVYTYLTRWDEERQSWIVEDFVRPSFACA